MTQDPECGAVVCYVLNGRMAGRQAVLRVQIVKIAGLLWDDKKKRKVLVGVNNNVDVGEPQVGTAM